jgi:uncharacterized protein YjdB
VTGVVPGVANISASVDGKIGNSAVTVLDGGIVTAAGAVLTLQSGTVQLSVPKDALALSTNLSVTPLANQADPRVIKATAFEFGPSGTTFAKPVVLKIRYDPANLAPGTEPAALELYLSTSSGWQVVAGSTVDLTAKVVSAEISHFSVYALLTPPPVASIVIAGPADRPVVNGASSLYLGESEQLAATLRASDGGVLSNRAITWTSSDPTIASITPVGLVAALAPGVTTVGATAGGVTSSIAVTVSLVPVGSVAVSLFASSITVGQTTQASAVLRDLHGNVLQGRVVAWTSANSLIASVSSDGTVTARGPGSATIIATSEGQTGSATVTVAAAPVASVSVGLGTGSLSVGGQTQATATLKDANNNVLTGRAVVWSSSNPAVATVSNTGVVSGLLVGSATITATSDGQAGSAPLTVTPPVATSFGLVGGIPPVIPIPLTAGSAVTPPPVLRATTASGIPVAGVRIFASVSPAGATLAGSTVVTDATGTATFSNLVVNGTAGNYTLTFAADGVPGTINFALSLTAAQTPGSLSITVTTPTPTDHIRIWVFGGNLSPAVSKLLDGQAMTSTTTTLALPAGGPYTVLAASYTNTGSGDLVSATGRSAAVTVQTGTTSTATVVTAPVTVTDITAPDSVQAGLDIPISYVLNDPGDLRNGIGTPGQFVTSTGNLWYGPTPFTGDQQAYGVVFAQATALGNGSYRYNGKIPFQTSPGVVYFQTSTDINPPIGGSAGLRYTAPSLSRGEPLRQVKVVPSNETLSITVTTPTPTDHIRIWVFGGNLSPAVSKLLDGQAMTSTTTTLALPAGGPYTVLAASYTNTGSGDLVSATGRSAAVTVQTGTTSTATVVTAPVTVTDITAPDSVQAGLDIPISYVLNDPGDLRNGIGTPGQFVTSTGNLWYGPTPFTGDQQAYGVVFAQATALGNGSYRYNGKIPFQTSPGVIYFQTSADINPPIGGSAGLRYTSPSLFRGEPLRQVKVVSSGGLTVSVSSPFATNEFIVAIDGGAFGSTAQVSHLTGSSMTAGTLTLGVPTGGPYRVRAIAVDPRSTNSTFPIMNASGKADNVTVSTGTATNVAITLAPMSVTITAPSTVTAGSQVQISWTYTDPGAGLARAGSPDGRLFYNTTPMTQDLTGTQLFTTGTVLSPTSYQFTTTFTAPTTPGTLYFNVAAQTLDLAIPGTSRAGWYVDPSLERGESLRQITVTIPAADVTPPALTNLTASTSTVDLTSGAQTVTFNISATDAGSGVRSLAVMASPPSGVSAGEVQCGGFSSTGTLGGTPADATAQCIATFPAGSAAGVWSFRVNLQDEQGNFSNIFATELANRGFVSGITVVSPAADVTPPALTNLTASTSTVDLTSGAQTVTFNISATDAGSGVRSLAVIASPPFGVSAGEVQCGGFSSTGTLGGTPADATAQCTATFPAGSAAGVWSLRVNLQDQQGNFSNIFATELASRGFVSGITVAYSLP